MNKTIKTKQQQQQRKTSKKAVEMVKWFQVVAMKAKDLRLDPTIDVKIWVCLHVSLQPQHCG